MEIRVLRYFLICGVYLVISSVPSSFTCLLHWLPAAQSFSQYIGKRVEEDLAGADA